MLDRLQYLRAHQRFHKRIADVARCAALSNTIEQVLALESTWLCAVEKTPNLEAPRHYHEELVEALAQGDPDRAAAGIRQHIGVGLDYIMEGLKRHFARRTSTFARRQTAP
jgi:DNA-binding GntR family transcriptional regulator